MKLQSLALSLLNTSFSYIIWERVLGKSQWYRYGTSLTGGQRSLLSNFPSGIRNASTWGPGTGRLSVHRVAPIRVAARERIRIRAELPETRNGCTCQSEEVAAGSSWPGIGFRPRPAPRRLTPATGVGHALPHSVSLSPSWLRVHLKVSAVFATPFYPQPSAFLAATLS